MHALIVIAKAPLGGLAKTRLGREGTLSVASVARLADAFLRDTVAACERVDGVELVLCFTPAESESYFRALAPNAHFAAQVHGDLGLRLSAAFDVAFALGASRAVAIGADTPHVPPRTLARAFRELDDFDCALGPADDGGFYLIALRERRPELFREIEWSTPRVLAQTLERARAVGASTTLLDALFDVDDVASLERLSQLLGQGGEPCPHTARALAEVRVAAADRARTARLDGDQPSSA